MKGHRFKFQSYDRESLRLLAERNPGIDAKLGFVITSAKTAVTREFADMMTPLMMGSMNPTSISNMLAELKSMELARTSITGEGRTRFLGELAALRPCSPGDGLLRRLFLDAGGRSASELKTLKGQKIGEKLRRIV